MTWRPVPCKAGSDFVDCAVALVFYKGEDTHPGFSVGALGTGKTLDEMILRWLSTAFGEWLYVFLEKIFGVHDGVQELEEG